jgi:membrane protease YdiL (CAAX protease family)
VSAEQTQQLYLLASAWLWLALPIAVVGGLAWWLCPKPICWRRSATPWGYFDVPIILAMMVLVPALCLSLIKEANWWRPSVETPPSQLVETLAPILGTGAAVQYANNLSEQHTMMMWAKILACVMTFMMVALLLHLTGRDWSSVSRMSLLGQIALSCGLWLFATPLVMLTNLGCNWVVEQLGQSPDTHPLTRVGIGETNIQKLLFILSACVCTPLVEEFVFRNLLINWATKSKPNPWIILGIATAFVLLLLPDLGSSFGPQGFLICGWLGLVLIQKLGNRLHLPIRTSAAIWSSAILFGAVHVTVWPTPIPLTLLGLFLGYLALRTGSWLGCAVTHGLFNGISTLYLAIK